MLLLFSLFQQYCNKFLQKKQVFQTKKSSILYYNFSLFLGILSLYIPVKVCYTADMGIFSYLQEKLQSKRLQRRKEKSALRFPVSCKVRGVKPNHRQSLLAQSRKGDNLQLVHVPTEQFTHQVCVYSVTLNCLLGYIEKELAESLVFVFGKGFCRDGIIQKITGGAPLKYFGCNIQILESKEFMKDCENFASLHGE